MSMNDLVDDHSMNPDAIEFLGYLDVDTSVGELRRINGPFHQMAGSQEPDAPVIPLHRLGGDLFGDVKPGEREGPSGPIKSLMDRVVGTNDKIGSCPRQLFRGGAH